MVEYTVSTEMSNLWEIEKAYHAIERFRNSGLLTKNDYEVEAGKLKAQAKAAAAAFTGKSMATP